MWSGVLDLGRVQAVDIRDGSLSCPWAAGKHAEGVYMDEMSLHM